MLPASRAHIAGRLNPELNPEDRTKPPPCDVGPFFDFEFQANNDVLGRVETKTPFSIFEKIRSLFAKFWFAKIFAFT
jgi:hypothetical protein